jgi:hypothetical protein
MSYYFGKGVAKRVKGLPAPDQVNLEPGAAAFGRYVRYGRRSRFGAKVPMFGKRRRSRMFGMDMLGMKHNMNFGMDMMPGKSCSGFGMYKQMSFGRRRKGARKGGKSRKGGVKGKKPAANLRRACKKHGIKCTRKVGKHRVYKSASVLKRLLRKKMKGKKGKGSKRHRKTRKTRRRRRVNLFGFKF